MKPLSASGLKGRLDTRIVGKRIVCLDRVESTNDAAWKEAVGGAADGTCVFAEEQTAGRGRFGRFWNSPPGDGLYVSIVLRRRIPAERTQLVTALGAIGVVEAVDETTGLAAAIRFPNDVMIGTKKTAGVLVEARFISSAPDLFVLGIGVNVGQEKFPSELSEIATSLRIETGDSVNRTFVARALLESIDRWYHRFEGPLDPFRRFWKKHSAMLGRRARVREDGKAYIGVVEDVDPIDGLVVRLANGHVRPVSGEHVEEVRILTD